MRVVLLWGLLSGLFLQGMDNSKIKVRSFVYSSMGKREKQEDRYVLKCIEHNNNKYFCSGIFDGHSGAGVAELAQDKFFDFFEKKLKENSSVEQSLKYACEQCEVLTKNVTLNTSGSTLLASCFESSSGRMSFLWLGDSQAFVDDYFATRAHVAVDDIERERIEKNGGRIVNGKLNGMIAVSRSLGDAFFKERVASLSAEYEYEVREIFKDYGQGFCKNSGYSIEASDGFWDVAKENSDIIQWLEDAKKLSHKKFYKKYLTIVDSDDDDCMSDEEKEEGVNIAQRLTYIATKNKGSSDNTTVVVQLFGCPDFLKISDESETSDGADTDNDSIENSLLYLQEFFDETPENASEAISTDNDNQAPLAGNQKKLTSDEIKLADMLLGQEKKKESVILPERSFIHKYKYVISGGIIALCALAVAVYKYK